MRARGELGGEENVRRLRAYLNGLKGEKRGLPARAGGPNLSAIAKACGFDRGVFYSNEQAKLLLDEAWQALGLDDHVEVPTTSYEAARIREEAKTQANTRINGLEQEILLLRAENAQLKAENSKFKAIKQLMIDTGRLP